MNTLQRLRWYLCGIAAGQLCEIAAAGRPGPDSGPRSEGAARLGVETKSH